MLGSGGVEGSGQASHAGAVVRGLAVKPFLKDRCVWRAQGVQGWALHLGHSRARVGYAPCPFRASLSPLVKGWC